MQLGGLQWLLEIALIGLLAATLFHALRLERALGRVKRDREALEELVRGFNAGTSQAEAGIERLRVAAEGAGRQIALQIEAAGALKGDLGYLNERGEQLADRLDALVRAGRPLAPQRRAEGGHAPGAEFSQGGQLSNSGRTVAADVEPADQTRLRSQAERDLMKALRLAR